MDAATFCLHALAAAAMGTAIGVERQWGLHTAGLRTNALVSFGACLFVSLPVLLGGATTPAQLAGQVVVGVGFLGGGVILREGLNVRGLNTAATLWCSAAAGALTGAGLVLEGAVATVGVLALNLALRPVADRIDRYQRRSPNVATAYRLRVTCRAGGEETVRVLLLRFFHDHPTLTVQGIKTQAGDAPDRACVAADVYADRRDDRAMEELMALVNDDPGVTAVSWERSPAA